jgi:hypothetical protein
MPMTGIMHAISQNCSITDKHFEYFK